MVYNERRGTLIMGVYIGAVTIIYVFGHEDIHISDDKQGGSGSDRDSAPHLHVLDKIIPLSSCVGTWNTLSSWNKWLLFLQQNQFYSDI